MDGLEHEAAYDLNKEFMERMKAEAVKAVAAK